MAREITDITPFIIGDRLAVLIKPNANSTHVIGFDDTRHALRIAVAAPATDNKANTELLTFLKRQTKRACAIERGTTSRKKIIRFF